MEKITYKGVEILLIQGEQVRHIERSGSYRSVKKSYSWTAETALGKILYNDFHSREKEGTITQIKAFIDSVDMLIAHSDAQLADYLSQTIVEGEMYAIHPVLMKMVLGNSRIPVRPSTMIHEIPDLINKPWWVRIKDWIESWNHKATPNCPTLQMPHQ